MSAANLLLEISAGALVGCGLWLLKIYFLVSLSSCFVYNFCRFVLSMLLCALSLRRGALIGGGELKKYHS